MRDRWGICASVVWLTLWVSACVSFERSDEEEPPLTSDADEHVCDDVFIDSEDAYAAARECTRIDGSLHVDSELPVERLAFPKLMAITGDVAPTYGDYPHPLAGLEFPALETVGGSVTLSATNLERIEWPKLRSVGGALRAISMPELVAFAAPKLHRIGGDVQFTLVPVLESIDLRALHTIEGLVAIALGRALVEVRCSRIEHIGGSASIEGLGLLSADDVLPLWEASDRTLPLAQIGCCSDDPGVVQANCGESSVFACAYDEVL